MASTIDDQFSAFGVAQVIVVLKGAPAPAAAAKADASLAAAIPVRESRAAGGNAQAVVQELGKFFRISQTGTDSAMVAASKVLNLATAATNWFRRAADASDPTPPARFFPHLGLMLGTVDRTGLAALRAHARVDKVVAPPALSLIQPVAAADVKPPRQYTWGVRRLKADELHRRGLTGSGVIVGHLDTGADGDHPALKGAFHSFAEFDAMGFQLNPPRPARHRRARHPHRRHHRRPHRRGAGDRRRARRRARQRHRHRGRQRHRPGAGGHGLGHRAGRTGC